MAVRDPHYHNIVQTVRESPEGNARLVQRVACASCEAVKDVASTHRLKPPQTVAMMAIKAGWTVPRKGDIVCPNCQRKDKTVPQSSKTKKPTPETPDKKLTPQIRRRIFAEIDGAYEDGEGYVLDMTDQKIAQELSLPISWVQEVRDLNFGPAGPDPRILKIEQEVEALKLKITEAEVKALEASDLADNLNKSLASLSTRLCALKKDSVQ